MKQTGETFRFYTSSIATLHPPAQRRRNPVIYRAQRTLQAIAKGRPSDFSPPAWRLLPWRLKCYGLRRVYFDHGYRFLFDPTAPASGISCALDWMLAYGWSHSPARKQSTAKRRNTPAKGVTP